jgi:diguanylate cyclase (GGDEF)-like protein
MIDIDHFKPINDRYGHAAGDHAIRMVAEAIQRSFRSGDEVCRYGGEEFVVLLTETSEAVAVERAEALRATLRELQIRHAGLVIDAPSVSIGLACHPRNGDTADALLGAADAALYAAKQGGRDRVVRADG